MGKESEDHRRFEDAEGTRHRLQPPSSDEYFKARSTVINSSSMNDSHTCFWCDKHFTKSRSMIRHLRNSCKYNASSGRRYYCDWCDSKFSRVDILQRHVQEIHLLLGNGKRMSKTRKELSGICYGAGTESAPGKETLLEEYTHAQSFNALTIDPTQTVAIDGFTAKFQSPQLLTLEATRRTAENKCDDTNVPAVNEIMHFPTNDSDGISQVKTLSGNFLEGDAGGFDIDEWIDPCRWEA